MVINETIATERVAEGSLKKVCQLTVPLSLFLATGCGTAYNARFMPPSGMIFTNVTAPLTTNFNDTKTSKRMGTATCWYLRDPFITGQDISWGKCDIESAARYGGLQKVRYADYSILQLLGIYGQTKVTAYGE